MQTMEWIVTPPLALGLSWSDVPTPSTLARITLAYAGGHEQSPTLSPRAKAVEAALKRYVRGMEPGWPDPESDLGMDFASLPRFTALVLRTLKDEVGHGRTVTYGQLAAMAGRPGAARAVGQALARNPWPLVVPCHRVLGADGSLTGFTNPAGLNLKQDLLAMEGVLDPA